MSKISEAIEYIKVNKNKQINIKELVSNHNELFLMIPLVAFIISPIYFIISLFTLSDYPFHGFYTYQYDVNYVIYLSLIAGPVAFAIYCSKKKREGERLSVKSNIPAVFFAAVCIMMIVSTIINGFTNAALHGDQYRDESIFSFIAYFAVFYFCGSLIKSDNNRKIIFYLFFIANTAVNLMTVVDKYIKPLPCFEMSDKDAPSSIFYQFNHYGYFLMIAIALSAAIFVTEKCLYKRILSLAVMIFNTFILTLNTTFGCFLACLVGFVFMLVIVSVRDKKFNTASLAALAIFLLVTYLSGLKNHSFINELGQFFGDIKSVLGSVNETVTEINGDEAVSSSADSAGTGRWSLWTNTLRYIKERPLFGWGIEGIGEKLNADTNGLNSRPHNEYLQYAAFFGIPAAVLYICGLISVFIKAVKDRVKLSNQRLACLVVTFTYLFSALFGNTMFYTAPYLFIFMGLSFAQSDT